MKVLGGMPVARIGEWAAADSKTVPLHFLAVGERVFNGAMPLSGPKETRWLESHEEVSS